MLVSGSRLIGAPVLSMQAAGAIANLDAPIVDPDSLKVLGFRLSGGVVGQSDTNILDVMSIREYSRYGCIVDSADEFVGRDDVIKIKDVLDLNFNLIGLKVETKKGSNLGKVIDFTVTTDDFVIQQIIVRRPALKAFVDPELTISRREVVEITDYKIVVKDEEKVLKQRAANEDFVPNFVNPFRKSEQDLARAETETVEQQDN